MYDGLQPSPEGPELPTEAPCDILVSLDEFRIPEVPPAKNAKAQDCKVFSDLSTSFGFDRISSFGADMFSDSAFLTGRPSLLFDDGRESLGILPQFKLPLGSKASPHFELESADSFLVSTGRKFDPFIATGRPSLLYDGRESLGILPHGKINFIPEDETIAELECWLQTPKAEENNSRHEKSAENLLKNFKKDCEAIECGDFIPDVADITDENYSVYVEANFLASKIADNSILDISQEGGSFLERTPQPDFIEDNDSLNQSDKKVDTQSVYRQVDLMLPPTTDHQLATITDKETQESGANLELKTRSGLLEHLSNLVKKVEHKPEVYQILQNAIKQISDLDDTGTGQQQNLSSVDEEDSGHSSAENDKVSRDCNAALDLSLKAHTSENGQALDLSFSKDGMPRRLSITFSHKNDVGLPDQPQSNKLKQQTMHMRQLWGSVNTTAAASSDGSIMSNDSKASSTSSMRVKLKPKKTEQDPKRGPLKAVVPLASLNTSLTMEHVVPKQRTPNAKFMPMARSTPEEFGADRRKPALLGSPVGRPGRTTRLSKLNRSNSMGVQPSLPDKSLTRGKSSADLKANKKPPMRRCYSMGGKENLSVQQTHKQITTGLEKLSFSKLPKLPQNQKVLGMNAPKM